MHRRSRPPMRPVLAMRRNSAQHHQGFLVAGLTSGCSAEALGSWVTVESGRWRMPHRAIGSPTSLVDHRPVPAIATHFFPCINLGGYALRKFQIAMFAAALVAIAGIAPSYAYGSTGTATSATSGIQVADAMADFGTPPSGEVPILFNDHHVYSKPDTLRQGRVLAAIVSHGTLLVPLRSMFEQMGATVSFDMASKSVTAKKEGAEVQVTLGKNEVIINGESRPLDVAPMMYKGT